MLYEEKERKIFLNMKSRRGVHYIRSDTVLLGCYDAPKENTTINHKKWELEI